MILLIDNYDSFTYNLYQYLGELHEQVEVIRNDQITPDAVDYLQPEAIIFSPGAGRPADAGYMEDIIRRFYRQIPMLGICLGHQAIGEVFGAAIVEAKEKMHGETSNIRLLNHENIFRGMENTLEVGRYHSLIIERPDDTLQVSAISEKGEIMAIQHRDYPVYGVQFHPESILTPCGKQILTNFITGRTGIC